MCPQIAWGGFVLAMHTRVPCAHLLKHRHGLCCQTLVKKLVPFILKKYSPPSLAHLESRDTDLYPVGHLQVPSIQRAPPWQWWSLLQPGSLIFPARSNGQGSAYVCVCVCVLVVWRSMYGC